jgi:hypothetical protein
MTNNLFWKPNLDKFIMSFDIDVSGIGCGCNGALYLVNMPASSQTSCGDYYCDANFVCGEGCAEFDIVEANNEACRVTAHKCTSSSSCDSGGCGFAVPNFGPSKKINTKKTIKVTVEFTPETVRTTFKQGNNEHIIIHDDESCGSGYMESLSKKWKDMVITASSWGDSGGGMAWLDGGVCDTSVNCNYGEWSFSNIKFYTESDDGYDWQYFINWIGEEHNWWQWLLFGLAMLVLFILLTKCFQCCFEMADKRKTVQPINKNYNPVRQQQQQMPQHSRQNQPSRPRPISEGPVTSKPGGTAKQPINKSGRAIKNPMKSPLLD